MFDEYTAYVSVHQLDEMGAQLEFIDVAEAPAIWIGVQAGNDLAGWCLDASMTTGLDLTYIDCRSAGVVLLGVDQAAYAMSYGNGHLLIPDDRKDQRFGLRFLVRRLDSGQVHDLVRRRPDARGRTDSTLVPAGAPVWTLGIAENVEIIRRIGGRAKDLKVTFSSRDNRPVNVEGSVGLRMRFGVEPPHPSRTSGSASVSALKRSPTRRSRSSTTSSRSPMSVRRTSSTPNWRDCLPGARTPLST